MVLDPSDDRRLTTIMAIDVVGYSRLMSEDEAGTLAALKEIRGNVLVPLVRQFGGRVFKFLGDGALVEFASVIKAVQCAVELQASMAAKFSELSPRAIQLRIGINLGDVVAMGSDLYGAGVNLASRLEGLAEPGGICIASSVHDHVTANPAWAWRDLGEQSVKNFAKPVRVYSFMSPSAAPILDSSESISRAKPAIAVLPLANMSGDPEQEFFADGLTEEILTELSRFRGLL